MAFFSFLDGSGCWRHTNFGREEKIKRQDRFRPFLGSRFSGLTLIELIIVVSVIALLVLLGLFFFKGQLFKGRDARRKSDIKRIQVAVEEYEKDHDCYPPPSVVVCDPGSGLAPYLNKIPCDPLTGESYFYEPQDLSCPSWYLIYAKLENQKDPDFIFGVGPGAAYSYVAGSSNAPLPTPAVSPTAGTGPSPTGGGQSGYWGCKNGVCTPLSSQTECSPNYTTSACGNGCDVSPECL